MGFTEWTEKHPGGGRAWAGQPLRIKERSEVEVLTYFVRY